MSESRITYTARTDATLESEREVLASVFAFVLRIHQEREKAACANRSEDVEGSVHGTGEGAELAGEEPF